MESFKVVCINAAPGIYGPVDLVKGNTYTVVGENELKDGWVLAESKSIAEFGSYVKDRFKRKEGSDFADSIAEQIETEINEEILEKV